MNCSCLTRMFLLISICLLCLLSGQQATVAADPIATSTKKAKTTKADWFDRKAQWKGYDQFHFKVAGQAAYLVAPKKAAKGNPWVWRARFPGYHAEMDVMLLAKGFHVGYVNVAGMFGSPKAIGIGEMF